MTAQRFAVIRGFGALRYLLRDGAWGDCAPDPSLILLFDDHASAMAAIAKPSNATADASPLIVPYPPEP